MTSQLTMTSEEVKVCLGCGLPRLEVEGFYALQNERCGRCRIEGGEDLIECAACEEDVFEEESYKEAICVTPWDDESETGFVYCQGCMDSGANNPDGQVFYCDWCNRDIADSNGRTYYYRILNDCEQICLKCIEDDLKSEGIAAFGDDALEDVFKGESLFGMFFNVGELEEEGWEPDPLYHNVCMGGGQETLKLGARAHGWHKSGRFIIIGYESMSIVGGEGYVTLYTKEKAA